MRGIEAGTQINKYNRFKVNLRLINTIWKTILFKYLKYKCLILSKVCRKHFKLRI